MSLKFVLSDISFRLVRMKASLAACKPLIFLDFHRSFNNTRSKHRLLPFPQILSPVMDAKKDAQSDAPYFIRSKK